MAKDRVSRLSGSLTPKNDEAEIQLRLDRADSIMAGREFGLLESSPTRDSLKQDHNQRSIFKLPITLLRDNPFNARKIYSQAVVEERARSLKMNCQYVPANVTEDWENPGKYILIDGHYRKRALQHNGEQNIEVTIIKAVTSNQDLYRISRRINLERSEQSVLDDALSWRQLLDMGECATAEEVAALDGISKGTVSKTLKILELPDTVIEQIEKNPGSLGLTICYELTLIHKFANDIAMLEKLVAQIVAEKMSARQVIAFREKLESGVARKPKELANHYAIKSMGKEIGALKVWPSGRISCEFTEEDEGKRAELLEKLKKALGNE